jgi:HPt (histidine-containing phosphotransfer) domain-containing protein
MAELFLQDCDGYLIQIQHAVANGDKQSLMMAAHTLKGSASNFAATPTCTVAMALEKIGRDGNFSQAPRLVHKLETALPSLTSALEQLCQDMAA